METVFKPSPARSATMWGLALSMVVTAPLLLLRFFGLQGPTIFSICLGMTVVLLMGFMLHVTFSGRRMSYELEQNGLKINFGLGGTRIPYAAFKDVRLSDVTLALRIYGGSWPGLFWGLFQAKDLGRVRVYSTRSKGQLILIDLVNGDKIVISPETPEDFLRAISHRSNFFGEMRADGMETLDVSRKIIYAQVLAVTALYIALLAYVFRIYPSLPEIIPVHFGLNWSPDRWGHKSELFFLAGVAAIFPATNGILALKFGRADKGLTIFLGILFGLVITAFLGMITFTLQSLA